MPRSVEQTFRLGIRASVTRLLRERRRRAWRLATIRRFEKRHGYTPNLERPRRYSEKLLLRILEDDDPHYTLYATKLQAPYFVARRDIDRLHFARRLKVRRRIEPRDFEDLPAEFAMKSSFGSGLNLLVKDRSSLDVPSVCARFNQRLPSIRNARGKRSRENCVVFEELLRGPDGEIPDDIKVECFNGRDGRFYCLWRQRTVIGDEQRDTYFDHDFNAVDFRMAGRVPHETPPEMPDNAEAIVETARRVSAGFDYIRVDLYNLPDGIYFGELTPFPSGGMRRIDSPGWDEKLGEIWEQRFPAFRPQDVPDHLQ
jgi:hypothetical protein